MTPENFNKVVHTRLNKCVDTLTTKAHEYAPDEDRLSNFKKAAALQSCTAPRALMGMMSKHMVALADFCNDPTHFSIEQWREKLTDNINYSLLLEALVMELMEVDPM